MLILSLLAARPAYARMYSTTMDIKDDPRMIDYLGSPSICRILYDLGLDQDRKLGIKDCAGRYFVRPMVPVIISSIDFPEKSANPVNGVWLLRYSLTRCGDTKIYNAIFTADPAGGFPKATAFFPGGSYASPLLIHDAMFQATVTALVKSGVQDCKEAMVYDMRPDGPPDKEGRWSEVWIFRVCGKMVDVPINFVPDRKTGGVTFYIKMN